MTVPQTLKTWTAAETIIGVVFSGALAVGSLMTSGEELIEVVDDAQRCAHGRSPVETDVDASTLRKGSTGVKRPTCATCATLQAPVMRALSRRDRDCLSVTTGRACSIIVNPTAPNAISPDGGQLSRIVQR